MASRIPVISFPEDLSRLSLSSSSKQHQTLRFILKLLYSSGYSLAGIYLIAIFVLKPMLKLGYDRRSSYVNHVYDRLNAIYTKLTTKVKYVPSVEVNYKGVIYKDSMCSTDEIIENVKPKEKALKPRVSSVFSNELVKEVRFLDETKTLNYNDLNLDASEKLASNLENLKETLNNLKVSSYNNKQGTSLASFGGRVTGYEVSEMQPLMFQIKQFKNYLEMVTADHPREYLFKRKITYSNRFTSSDTKKNTLNLLDDFNDELNDLKMLVNES